MQDPTENMKRYYDCTGSDLKKARQSCHLTQKLLAKISGLHVNSIKRLERFDRVPTSSCHALEKIVAALGSAGLDEADRLLEGTVSKPLGRYLPEYNFATHSVRARACHGVLVSRKNEFAQPAQVKSRCGAKTRAGEPCKRKALNNGRCRNHGGLSTGPKTQEGRRRISIAQTKRWARTRRI